LVYAAQLYYNVLCKKFLNIIFLELEETREDLLQLQKYWEKLKYLMFPGS